jgi:hypothetical protein
MFPFRTSSIFRSRWMALLWAAGIVWSAAEFASSHQAGGNDAAAADGGTADPDQMKQAEALLRNIGG